MCGQLSLALLASVLAAALAQAGHPAASSPELAVTGRFSLSVEDLTTDVWALGNYAYLGSLNTPLCSSDHRTGV